MKAKFALVTVSILLLVTLGVLAGCSKAKSDSQIAGEVQGKIFSDQAIQGRQITVNSTNGVVTLSGYANSDAERAAAATDAAQIDGVKTVVNNLQVQAAQANPPENQQAAQQQAPEPEPAPRRGKTRATTTYGRNHGSRPATSAANNNNVTDYSSGSQRASNAPQDMNNAAPAPPPPPAKVTVPDGTVFSVRLTDGVDSERNQVGDTFHGSLDSPIVVGDQTAIPPGADVQGRVVDVKSAGRFAGASTLVLELTQVAYNGHTYPIHTNQWAKSGTGRGKSTAAKVGGGAALGALIGGLAGGGKGAAIGATVGAGAGTGVSAAGHGQQIQLGPESVVNFQLQSPITVTASSTRQRGGQRLESPQQ
jgi:BON domain